MPLLLLVVVACVRIAPAPRSSPHSAPGPEPAGPEIPTDLRDAVDRSVIVGREIYLQDKAAAIGAEVLMGSLKTLEGQGLGGYLALRRGNEAGQPLPAFLVCFFSDESEPHIRYEVNVPIERNQRPSLATVAPPRRAPEPLAKLIRARKTAIEAAGPFDHAVHPVVLPDPDGVLVYILAAPTRPKTIVLGKHYRVLVGTDGAAKTVEPLSKIAIELATVAPDGSQPKALFVTQIVTAYPLETHVAASLTAHLPIYVATSRGLWAVDGDSISYVSQEIPDDMNKSIHGTHPSAPTQQAQ
jgi:hypothetical protein